MPPDAHIKFREPLSFTKFHPEILAERQPSRLSGKHILRKLRRKMLRAFVLSDGGMMARDSVMQLWMKQMLS